MYRIIDGGNIYTLDSTTQGSIRFSGKATDKPLQDGTSASDHYVNLPTTISFNGVISDAKTLYLSGQETTLSLIEKLKQLKESGRPFIFEGVKDSALVISNCVFDSLVIENDQTHGRVTFDNGVEIYSFRISCEIKQLKRARRGRVVSEPQVVDTTSSQSTGSGVNVAPNEVEAEEKKATYSDTRRYFDLSRRSAEGALTGELE